MTLLLLDGQPVRGQNMKITANLRIESDDLSGQTSNSEAAHKGFKPKTLTVTLTIRYTEKSFLRDLMRMAESTEGGGQRKTYRVVNDTAEGFGVRQVQFSDGVSAREDDSLHCWRVQFTLSEKLSNPERVEKRRPANASTAQGAPGQAVGGDTGAAGEPEKGTELTGFETTLKKLDTWLGGS
ncbi:MAG: DNA-binding protein [Pseudomonas qingdaonensis]|uniref:baseplate complex protein n=1 Tax=Pseudomonas qingdaonensis TaxID=2056231 RepID=UPI001E42253D